MSRDPTNNDESGAALAPTLEPPQGSSFPRCSQCSADGACNCTGLCPACDGRCISPDGTVCATCAGYGTEPRQLANLRRPTSVPKLQRCAVCRGTGVTDGECCACGGTGRVLEWAAMPPSPEPAPFSDAVLDRAEALARIALAFGRVNRITRHEDGIRPETDTDHTVMLTLVAMDIAPRTLNLGMVAAYSSVHDLVEVYAFDTQTMVISPEALAEKRKREKAALDRLIEEFGRDSWLSWLLQTYEAQRVPEARFVRLVDKILPGLTHALNGCAAARPLVDRDGFIAVGANQLRKLSADYPEFPEALDLLRRVMAHAESRWPTTTPAEPSGASFGAALGADGLRAALEPAEPLCTGYSAAWCPRCGDCACRDDPAFSGVTDNDACPLHSVNSLHAETEAPPPAAVLPDRPELDCTDGAHPAWWRGYNEGARSIGAVVQRALHGGPLDGVYGHETARDVDTQIRALRAERDAAVAKLSQHEKAPAADGTGLDGADSARKLLPPGIARFGADSNIPPRRGREIVVDAGDRLREIRRLVDDFTNRVVANDLFLRAALSRMGVADCDDPIAALNGAIDDMEQRERVATDEHNALVMERDKLRRDLSDARPLSWLWRPGDDE